LATTVAMPGAGSAAPIMRSRSSTFLDILAMKAESYPKMSTGRATEETQRNHCKDRSDGVLTSPLWIASAPRTRRHTVLRTSGALWSGQSLLTRKIISSILRPSTQRTHSTKQSSSSPTPLIALLFRRASPSSTLLTLLSRPLKPPKTSLISESDLMRSTSSPSSSRADWQAKTNFSSLVMGSRECSQRTARTNLP